MSVALSSMVVAGMLAFHPFGSATQVGVTEPQPDPSWDEPEEPAADPAADPAAEAEPTAGDPAEAVAPEPVPAAPVTPIVVTRPVPPKGTGLLIGASVTGGLAWVTVFARLSAIGKCKTAVAQAVLDSETGIGAGFACLRSAGSLISLTPLGWALNGATYGLAPAAGAARGKYDGTNAAWDGSPERNTQVFVGVGAGLLGAGVVGRLATIVAFWRQFNPGRVFQSYPLSVHFLMAQVSAASIAGGAGMLSYGLSYKRHRSAEEGRRKAAGLANVRLAPQLGWDYTGISLSGRF